MPVSTSGPEVDTGTRAITIHTRRTFGAISDRQRALIAQDAQHVIGALLSVPDAPAKDIFIALLPHRDSVLRSIAASHAATRADGSGEFLEQLQSLRERYLAAVLSRGPGSAQRVKEIAEAIEGLEALAAAAGSRMPEGNPADVLTLACRRLPADAALVKFVAYEYTAPRSPLRTSPAHAALVVRGDGCRVQIVRLASSDKIEAAAERFAQAMRAQRSDAEEERAELSRLLLAPLGPALSGAKRWLVIPDGSLWGVPIGAPPLRQHASPETPWLVAPRCNSLR